MKLAIVAIVVVIAVILGLLALVIWITMVSQIAEHIGFSYEGGIWFAVITYLFFGFDKDGSVSDAIEKLFKEWLK